LEAEDRRHLVEKVIEHMYTIRHQISFEMKSFFNDRKVTQPQWMVLHIIKKRKKTKVKDIAGILSITSSAATQIINGLVAKGLLIRKRNPEDRRMLKIELSEESNKQFEAIRNIHMKTLTAVFDVLSDEELLLYSRLNDKITGSIKSPGDKSGEDSLIKN
jgi:DNA-binding MarR family transcriptional regulator